MRRRESSAFRSLGCAATFFVAAALACVALVVLQRFAPTPREPEPALPPGPAPVTTPSPPPRAVPVPERPPPRTRPTPAPVEPDERRTRVGSSRPFERRLQGSSWALTWGFVDHHGTRRRLACRVDQRDHEREVFGFGYDKGAVAAARDARLRAFVQKALQDQRLESHVRATVHDGGWRAEHTIAGTLGPAEQERLGREIEQFYAWLKPAFRREWDHATRDLLAERGLRLEDDTYEIDHAGVAERASGPLEDCTRALDAVADPGRRRQLGVFLAFFQEIPYERPPREWRGRSTLGFYVPTEVLVGNHGDCDSKSVAFAAMWRHFARPVLLIRVPGHMLVGVEMRPGPGERFVRMGNRYFVLCEVVGPAKRHPGSSDASGWFEYVLIEPTRGAPERGRSRLPGS